VLCGSPTKLSAQSDTKWDIYGFAMTDAGYNFNQIQPDWYDVVRPTKLPSFKNEFGPDGSAFFSVRQTRFGVKTNTETGVGNLFTQFEWEMFGTGVDAGQTTIRLRHAYGELGMVGAGQYWSPFMDIDEFPNTVEYWGPSGMPFFRNVQVRIMPIKGDSRFTIALERPGASADGGLVADRIAIQDVRPRFPVPDVSAEYRYGQPWGYVELAGILRYMKWEDQGTDAIDLTGHATGWGLHLSSNLFFNEKKSVVRLGTVYGEGIENYMNDAPVDVGPETSPGDALAPISGVALPLLGVTAFVDHSWNQKVSSSLGYSVINIHNSNLQAPSAFHEGQYAVGNLMFNLAPGVITAAELQWGHRDNFSDGFSSDIFKVQFSFKYNFARTF
jgi:hypothetical protein